MPTEVIEERTDYALPKGHYGRGLLDQLAKSGEIEAASAPGAERRLWRLSALSADPVYRAAQRAVAYPEKPPGEARLSQR